MRKLIHNKDLKLYSIFLDKINIHNQRERIDKFYEWAVAKGYKTHKHLLTNINTEQYKLERFT